MRVCVSCVPWEKICRWKLISVDQLSFWGVTPSVLLIAQRVSMKIQCFVSIKCTAWVEWWPELESWYFLLKKCLAGQIVPVIVSSGEIYIGGFSKYSEWKWCQDKGGWNKCATWPVCDSQCAARPTLILRATSNPGPISITGTSSILADDREELQCIFPQNKNLKAFLL